VQRRQLDAVLDCLDDFIGNQYGLLEPLATMNNAMTNRLNISMLLISSMPDSGDAAQRAIKSTAALMSRSEAVDRCGSRSGPGGK
jgi:hypothetical protein